MRKGIIRRIALNLAIVMLLSFLPAFGGQAALVTNALAAGDQKIYVGYQTAKEVSFYYDESASGSGWRYDPYEQALYLTNYSGGGIFAGDNLTVYTSGTCSVTGGQYTIDGITYGANAFATSDSSLRVYVQSGTLTATGGNSNYRSGSALRGSTIYLDVESGAAARLYAGQTTGSYNGEYRSGADAVSANGNVTIYNAGTLTVTAKDAVFWGGYGVYCRNFYYYGGGTATITAGNTTGTEHDGGLGIGAGGDVEFSGTGSITVKGGNASTSSSAQRTGGAAVWSESGSISIMMGCTLTGGNGYYAGPAIRGNGSDIHFKANDYANGKQGAITLTAGSGQNRWALWAEEYSYSGAFTTKPLYNQDECCYQITFTVNSYTLKIDGNGGKYSGSSSKTLTKPYSTVVDLSGYAFTKSGYTLVAWEENSTGNYYAWNTSYRIYGDDTLVAQYEQRETGDVLLLPGKNTGTINGYVYYYFAPGDYVQLPSNADDPLVYGTGKTAPTMDAMHINQSPIYVDQHEANPSKQTTLYAYHAYVTSFTNLVIYHPTEGSVKQGGNALWQADSDELTVLGASYLTAPSGMQFAGWSTDWGGPVEYEPGEKIPYYKERSRRDLYAVWEPITHTLTLDGNGGTVDGMSSSKIKVEENDWVWLPKFDAYRPGYSLTRWYDSSAGKYYTWRAYVKMTKDTTLKAQWQQRKNGDLLLLPSLGTAARIKNGSSGVDYVYYSSGASVTLPSKDTNGNDILWAPTSEVYYFDHADAKHVFYEPVYTDKYTAPADEQTTLYSQRIGITASWGSLIVYHPTDGKAANGGDLLMQEIESFPANVTKWHTVIDGSYLEAPECKRLAGWSKTAGGAVAYSVGEEIPLQDNDVLHLYAVWALSDYKVTLTGNGKTETVFVPMEEPYLHLPSSGFEKTGYTLTRWYDSATSTYHRLNEWMKFTQNTTLTAQYQQRKNGDLLLLPNGEPFVVSGQNKDFAYYSDTASATLPTKTAAGNAIVWSAQENLRYRWNADSNGVCRAPIYTGTFAIPANKQTTLYACANGHTVSYTSLIVYHPTGGAIKQGGDLLMQERDGAQGSAKNHTTIDESYLTAPSGTHLVGWAESPSGKVMYEIGEKISLHGNERLDLYAVWGSEEELANGWRGQYIPSNRALQLTIPASWASANGAKKVIVASYNATGKYKKTVVLAQYTGSDMTISYSASQYPTVAAYAVDQNYRPIAKYTITVTNNTIELA